MPLNPPRGPFWLRWADPPRRAIGVVSLVSMLVVGVSLGFNGVALVGWHAATRSTAVLAYGLWLPSFCASALAALFPNSVTRALLARRRAIGLGFAVALAVHGLAILRLASLESGMLELNVGLVGGGLGYALVGAMAATSNEAAIGKLGRDRWKLLHKIGQGFLVVIFAFTYLGRITEDLDYWPALVLLVGALGLRLAARFQSTRFRSKTLPTE